MLLIGFCLFLLIDFYRGISKPIKRDGEAAFTIVAGEGVKEIGDNLLAANLIESKLYFKIYVWLKGDETKFQAGEYQLDNNLSLKEIVKKFVSGESLSREKNIKLIEGWGASEMARYLEKTNLFSADNFLKEVGLPKEDYRYRKDLPQPKDYSRQFSFLEDKPKFYGLEGYLFPDTYRIYRDSTVQEVVTKILSNFDKKFDQEMRAAVARRGKTIYQAVIMASILEKEVRTAEDMSLVSDIFWRRIARGQALQSDATLSYALGDKQAAHSLDDLQLDSPYNTYKYVNLPPTPISNPGLTALRAAVYPAANQYNYFLSTKDGKTIFSKTFEEHNQNKRKYLK